MTSSHPKNSKSQSASNGMRIFITGAAGYIGAMLTDQFSERKEVEKIICLDKRPQPEFLKGKEKITWITANTSDGTWQTRVAMEKPEVVIHAAWQIREMYGKPETQWEWNVEGSDAVFDFAFTTPGVERLIHFSTASGYGAEPTNTLDHHFTEDEPLRERIYLYGIEKIETERRLREKYDELKKAGQDIPQVAVIRPAAITGPRGRHLVKRFGLQSVLQKGLPIIPITTDSWCRQFIHEDDVTDIVALFTFKRLKKDFDIFNITPPSVVLGKDMAEVMGKKTLRIPPALARFAFFVLWHLSRGKIPTSRGGWRFYSYPIVLDGSKLTREYGYKYQWDSRPALEKIEGRYAKFVPEK